MPQVNFTSALKRFFPSLQDSLLEGESVRDILNNLEKHYPGLCSYLLEEDGSLRKHVNIYIGENLIQDRQKLSDQLDKEDEVLIFQALSGG